MGSPSCGALGGGFALALRDLAGGNTGQGSAGLGLHRACRKAISVFRFTSPGPHFWGRSLQSRSASACPRLGRFPGAPPGRAEVRLSAPATARPGRSLGARGLRFPGRRGQPGARPRRSAWGEGAAGGAETAPGPCTEKPPAGCVICSGAGGGRRWTRPTALPGRGRCKTAECEVAELSGGTSAICLSPPSCRAPGKMRLCPHTQQRPCTCRSCSPTTRPR